MEFYKKEKKQLKRNNVAIPKRVSYFWAVPRVGDGLKNV